MKPFIGHLWYHKKGPFFLIENQTLAQRKAEIVSKNPDGTWYKPEREHAARLRLIRKIAWKDVPKSVQEVYRARNEARRAWDKADRAWDKADRAWDKADRAWDEARRAWDKANQAWRRVFNGSEMMALHDTLCSEEDWDKKNRCIRFPEVSK